VWLKCSVKLFKLAVDETGGGTFECGNEPSGSIKCGEFFLGS
jgi:hypothetical protein